jgi:hypothetical protein
MAFVPVPNTIQVDVIYMIDSQGVENTLYFENPDGWDLASIEAFLINLRDLIQTELMPLLSVSIQVIELVARLLDTASSIGFTMPATPGVTGGNPNEPAPNNVTYTVSFRTGLTGRSFRGRNYVPGIPNDQISTNTILADFRTGVLAFYTELKTLATDAGLSWVVVSRYSGVDSDGKPIPRVTGVTTPIQSVGTADFTVDSQRRRLPGRGR